MEARKHIAWDVPVVLFSWTHDFWRWSDSHYPYDTYGKIVWDTHLYTSDQYSVDDALNSYDGYLA